MSTPDDRRVASEHTEASKGPETLDRLTVLVHELGNLLDGSMRCLRLASSSLEGEDQYDAARSRIGVAESALARMSDLVEAAMKGSASSIGSSLIGPEQPVTLGEAIVHACDVVSAAHPEASIDFTHQIGRDVGPLPAGPSYTVILNALHNAAESILQCDGRGSIAIRAERAPDGMIEVEVDDDGRGLPGGVDQEACFHYGFTTKTQGLGIGLAVASNIVRSMRGSIEIRNRSDRPNPDRPGATFTFRFDPACVKPTDIIGGSTA